MKLLTIFFFLSFFLSAGQLQIVADRFDRDQLKGISSFTGHVKIKKDRDELNATKVLVYTDESNHPIRYEASGNVSFSITSEENTTYQGEAQKMLFFPHKKEYQFFTDVFLKETKSLRTLSGDKIIINSTTGNAKIVGKKKEPVRVTFEIDEKNTTKTGLNSTPNSDTNASDKNTTQKIKE